LCEKSNVGSRKAHGYISVSGTLLMIDVISSAKSHKWHDYAHDGTNRPVSHMTRSELLQIGRSCNPGVLRA
jgi:hypothetical protein